MPRKCIFCDKPGLPLAIYSDTDPTYISHACDTHWDVIYAIATIAIEAHKVPKNESATAGVPPRIDLCEFELSEFEVKHLRFYVDANDVTRLQFFVASTPYSYTLREVINALLRN